MPTWHLWSRRPSDKLDLSASPAAKIGQGRSLNSVKLVSPSQAVAPKLPTSPTSFFRDARGFRPARRYVPLNSTSPAFQSKELSLDAVDPVTAALSPARTRRGRTVRRSRRLSRDVQTIQASHCHESPGSKVLLQKDLRCLCAPPHQVPLKNPQSPHLIGTHTERAGSSIGATHNAPCVNKRRPTKASPNRSELVNEVPPRIAGPFVSAGTARPAHDQEILTAPATSAAAWQWRAACYTMLYQARCF